MMPLNVSILNTHGEEITKWFPKNSECTVKGLKSFIETNLFVPVANQVLYHQRRSMDLKFPLLLSLLENDKNSPEEITLAYKTNSTSKMREWALKCIERYRLQKLNSIRVKDAKYQKTFLSVPMECLNTYWGYWETELTQKIEELYNIPYSHYDFKSNSSGRIVTGEYVEDLFFLGSKFEENIELVLEFSEHHSKNRKQRRAFISCYLVYRN